MFASGSVQVPAHGGDDSVKRDGRGRPLLLSPCTACDGSGRAPSTKRAGSTVQCPKKCEGRLVETSFTRVTTHIDVLDDKSNLADWKLRMALRGLAMQPGLLDGVLQADPDSQEGKRFLNMLAQRAMKVGGSEKASEHGNKVHKLSELVDGGIAVDYSDLSLDDIIAIQDYESISTNLKPVMIEQLVVHDELGVAGTPDRIEEWQGASVFAPDLTEIKAGDRLITDLKTGSMYGGLKMAMQLAVYSRSQLYAPSSSVGRESLGPVRTDWGLIKSVPAKGGKPALYWANLDLGWEAVLLASEVRRMRGEGRNALTEFTAAVAG